MGASTVRAPPRSTAVPTEGSGTAGSDTTIPETGAEIFAVRSGGDSSSPVTSTDRGTGRIRASATEKGTSHCCSLRYEMPPPAAAPCWWGTESAAA